MIESMPRPRPPHLQRQVTRHCKTVWYVRVGKGKRIKLHSEFGSPDFQAEYQGVLWVCPTPREGRSERRHLGLVDHSVSETTAWSNLSGATRRQREEHRSPSNEWAGQHAFAKITAATIMDGRDRRAATPAQARHFLDTMRGLFRWAAKAKLVRSDPTVGVENPAYDKGDGFIAWTEEHVAAYEARWPIGTRQRVWLDVLLYTGLRRRRRRSVRAAACARRYRDHQDRKDRNGCHAADPPSISGNTGRRPPWRSNIYRRRGRAPVDQKRFIRQPVSPSLQSRWRAGLGTSRKKDCRCPRS